MAQKLKVALNITAVLPLGYDTGQELKAGHGECHKDNVYTTQRTQGVKQARLQLTD